MESLLVQWLGHLLTECKAGHVFENIIQVEAMPAWIKRDSDGIKGRNNIVEGRIMDQTWAHRTSSGIEGMAAT